VLGVAAVPVNTSGSFFAPLGAFFAGLAFLADLAFFGARWARSAPTRAFLVGFGGSPVAVAWAVPVSSAIVVDFAFSFGGDYRGHDMDHSETHEKQANSEQKNG